MPSIYSLVSNLPYIGSSYVKKLNTIGIETISDLIFHFPFRYEDTSIIVPFNELSNLTKLTTKGTLIKFTNIKTRYNKSIQKGVIIDGPNKIEIIWFNQPFLKKNLKIDNEYLFYGKLSDNNNQLLSPDYQLITDKSSDTGIGNILPIYNLTSGITNKWLTKRILYILGHLNEFTELEETLDNKIIKEFNLLTLTKALSTIHQPKSHTEIKLSRERFGFEELLNIQIHLLKERKKRLTTKSINTPTACTKDIEQLISNLTYTLTKTQKTTIDTIFKDYSKNYPMKRLIQGDVGSGKTIVSILAMIPIIKNGHQVVFLAPTEVLAKQQYHTVKNLLKDTYKISLITSNTPKKIITTERIDIIVSTHAILFRKNELISDLGLLIIDEQHRFGVKQRRELLQLKSKTPPHQLFLTATPIPRTLAQSLFGDLDVSRIDTISNRKPIETRIVPESKRQAGFKWINDFINNKSQAFWICPLIEEGIESNLKSVEQYFKEIKRRLPNKKIKSLHGKMSSEEKNNILSDFQNGKFDILVSTTVVEVGIDIPNATLIVIEDADRFGLAQLHQLRGRVGRNNKKSWCLLYSNLFNSNKRVTNRLNYFASENNGISIAEYDLNTRGPGEVYGTIQSGLPDLKIASFSNIDLIKKTKKAANLILNS